MNKLLSMLCVCAMFALTSCGGADTPTTTASAAGVIYAGKTTPATVTAINAKTLASNAAGGIGNIGGIAGGAISSDNQNANAIVVAQHLTDLANKTLTAGNQGNTVVAVGAIQAINQTINGTVSGTAVITGQEDPVTLLGNATVTFNNYSDDGITTVSGSMSVASLAYDVTNNIALHQTMNFNALTIVDTSTNVTLSGSISDVTTVTTNTRVLTVNFTIQDNLTAHQAKLENIVVTLVYDNVLLPVTTAASISGRIFDSTYGYVNITTTAPMLYANAAAVYPYAGGPAIYSGATGASGGPTRVRLTPQSATTVLIEADTNGDGVYDYSSGTIQWSTL